MVCTKLNRKDIAIRCLEVRSTHIIYEADENDKDAVCIDNEYFLRGGKLLLICDNNHTFSYYSVMYNCLRIKE